MNTGTSFQSQRAWVVLCVGVLHALALYAMHAGLLRQATEPVQLPVLVSQVALLQSAPPLSPAPLAPQKVPTTAKAPTRPKLTQQPQPSKPIKPAQAPPILQTQSPQVQQAPAPVQTTQASAMKAEPSVAPAVPAATMAGTSPVRAVETVSQPIVELPSSSAAYLNNPKPAYPPISKHMGEQGRVMVRVFINADGNPGEVRLHKSSGYDRLDQIAIDTVKRWRFVPGKRGGVAEGMWFNVPIDFVLD
jgi:periplasmic protein TonB